MTSPSWSTARHRQIVALASDLHEDFVEVPDIAEPPLATLEIVRVLRPEFSAPLPDRLVGNEDATLREQFLDIAKAQGEPIVQPDAVADDLRGKPVAAVRRQINFHPQSLARSSST